MGLQQVLREGRRPCDASWGLTSNVWVEQSWATPGCSTPLIDGPTSAGAVARGAFLEATVPVYVGPPVESSMDPCHVDGVQ